MADPKAEDVAWQAEAAEFSAVQGPVDHEEQAGAEGLQARQEALSPSSCPSVVDVLESDAGLVAEPELAVAAAAFGAAVGVCSLPSDWPIQEPNLHQAGQSLSPPSCWRGSSGVFRPRLASLPKPSVLCHLLAYRKQHVVEG